MNKCSSAQLWLPLFRFHLVNHFMACDNPALSSVPLRWRHFENETLFLQLGLPSTLIRHENEAFRKRSSKRRYLKTLGFHFRVNGKLFENGAVLNG